MNMYCATFTLSSSYWYCYCYFQVGPRLCVSVVATASILFCSVSPSVADTCGNYRGYPGVPGIPGTHGSSGKDGVKGEKGDPGM